MPLSRIPEYKVNQVYFDGATKLEHYMVIDTRYNGRPARILYTDNRTAAQSGLPFDNNPELLFDYNERFMEIVRGLRPEKVLLIGGGAFTLPTAINREFPQIEVDIFEIDGGLKIIAERYFGFKENQNVKVYVGDGKELLKTTKNKYDLIILDVFNSINVPESFQKRDLAKKLKDRLKGDGLVAMNVIAAYHGERAEMLKKIDANFKRHLVNVEIFPAGSAMSLWISQNFIVVAGNNPKVTEKFLSYKPLGEI